MTVYYASFKGVSISAIQDLFVLTAASATPVTILRINITQNTEETSEQLPIEMRVVSGSPTLGSGGTSPTPEPANRATTRAAATTVDANDTTQQSGGTTELTWQEGFNMLAGFDWRATPDDEITIAGGEYFVVELPTAPASPTSMNGLIVFREG